MISLSNTSPPLISIFTFLMPTFLTVLSGDIIHQIIKKHLHMFWCRLSNIVSAIITSYMKKKKVFKEIISNLIICKDKSRYTHWNSLVTAKQIQNKNNLNKNPITKAKTKTLKKTYIRVANISQKMRESLVSHFSHCLRMSHFFVNLVIVVLYPIKRGCKTYALFI